MGVLVRHLEKRRRLGEAFVEGTDRNLMTDLLETAADYCRAEGLGELAGYRPFWNRRPASRRDFLDCMAAFFDSAKASAIIGFQYDGGSHWTVMTGWNGHSIRFADSGGASSLPTSGITVTGANRISRRCHIETGCTFLLTKLEA
jgi:hypothetical protein